MAAERTRPSPHERAQTEHDHIDALLDEALGETFPASDLVAICLGDNNRPDGGGVAPRNNASVASNAAEGSDVSRPSPSNTPKRNA